jgi:uncharacterized protein YebE (UPF0316 family)
VHLITRLANLYTNKISLILSNNVDIILNNSIYNNEHTCTIIICLSKTEKMCVGNVQQSKILSMRSDYPLPNKKDKVKYFSIGEFEV